MLTLSPTGRPSRPIPGGYRLSGSACSRNSDIQGRACPRQATNSCVQLTSLPWLWPPQVCLGVPLALPHGLGAPGRGPPGLAGNANAERERRDDAVPTRSLRDRRGSPASPAFATGCGGQGLSGLVSRTDHSRTVPYGPVTSTQRSPRGMCSADSVRQRQSGDRHVSAALRLSQSPFCRAG